MLSCPFLRTLSPATIQKDIQQLLNLVPKCPVARRLFDENTLNHARMYSSSIVVAESTTVESSVCKDVSECLLKKCPYASSFALSTVTSDTKLQNDSSCTETTWIQENNHVPQETAIPTTCALFAGWKKSKIDKSRAETSEEAYLSGMKSVEHENNSTVFDYNKFFASEIERKKQDSTYRVFRRILRDASEFPFADDYSSGVRRRIAVWCSNDYLGMSWHPKVQEAAILTVRKHGVGSGGTRNISGNSILHEALEAELADLHGKESALVFTSCYVANEAILYTLGTRIPNLTILSDAGNHASMIHGIKTSRCAKRIFKHNNVEHLKSLMLDLPINSPKLVAFETVHSMSGDICPLKELLDVIESQKALSFVDEVHAVGLYGPRGAGVAERDGQMHRIDAITGTLGKAFATMGGYLAGNRDLVDMIRSYASGFIFTTSLPLHSLAASRASIEILKSDEGRQLRAEHQKRVSIVGSRLRDEGLPVIEAPSHIVPIHVGDAKLCTQISDELLFNHHIYIQSINYPTVDKGSERLRIAPTPHHTDKLTEQLIDSLCSIWRKYDLPLNKSTRSANRRPAPA